jgi:phosphomevalonate kinase
VARAGSGIDVAASVYGGTLRCVRDGEGLRVEPVATPSGLVPRVVFTGASARTSTLVAAVEALEARDPSQAAALLAAIAAAAAAFDAALLARSTGEALAAVSAHAAAMAALGDAAGAPIVEARLARIGSLAHASAGAAKPSGAGGGDVALAFFADEPSATRFDAACAGEGFVVVPVSLGAEGARLD